MRRAVAVAAKLVQQTLRGAVRRAGIAHRHDAAEPVAAVGICHDGAAQVEGRLALVEERVVAHQVGVPHLHLGAGQRQAARVVHGALHEEHLAPVCFGAVVQAGEAFGFRGAGHVQRAFDGARRGAGQAGAGIGLVGADVDEALQPDARGQQAQLVRGAGFGQVFEPFPDFARLQVQVFDGLEQVAHQAHHHLLHPSVDGAGGGVDQEGFHQGVDVCVCHVSTPRISLWE